MFGPAVIIPRPPEPQGRDITAYSIGIAMPLLLIGAGAVCLICAAALGGL